MIKPTDSYKSTISTLAWLFLYMLSLPVFVACLLFYIPTLGHSWKIASKTWDIFDGKLP